MPLTAVLRVVEIVILVPRDRADVVKDGPSIPSLALTMSTRSFTEQELQTSPPNQVSYLRMRPLHVFLRLALTQDAELGSVARAACAGNVEHHLDTRIVLSRSSCKEC